MLDRRTAVLGVLIAFGLGGLSAAPTYAQSPHASAAADAQWRKNHPNRAEVNSRLDRQNKRIDQELKEGKITQQQAQQMHAQDRQIHQEENAMAHQNGNTHITGAEQKALNQQENAVSQDIGR
jgi:hypothetical protein